MKKYCLLLPRLRFIMKLSLLQIFISTALLSAVHANPGHGQNLLDRTVTLDIKNKPVKKVLAEIELLTHVKFAYRSDVVALNNRVNLEAQNEPLGQVLNRLLENKIACEIIGDQILLTAAHNFFYQDLQSIEDKSIAVTGKILDEKGEPLAGVTIVVKETTLGTISDAAGKFSIDVPDENSVLSFSYVGYITQQITVGQQTEISITLKEDVRNLDEVVVVGYGEQKKSDITGAIVNIKAENTNLGGASTSVDQMLSGRVAGLQFTQNSSQPGGAGTVIIRGRNSLFLNTDPLYVIDGFIVNAPSSPGVGTDSFSSPASNPLNSINPNDIESVAILKDAAATAIYGAKASNGVVLITTKRGKGGMKVSYDTYYSLQTFANQFEVMNAQDYMQFWSNKGTIRFTEAQIKSAQTTDWFKLISRTGQVRSHNISLSSSAENLNCFFSLGYFGNDGIIKNSGLERLSGRSNVQYHKNKFSLNTNIFATHIANNNIQTEGGYRSSIVASAIAFAPYLPVRDNEGVYSRDPYYNFLVNPVSMLDIKDLLKSDKLNFSFGASYEVLPGLKPEVRVTYDVQDDLRSFYVPATTPFNGNIAHGGTGSQSSQRAVGYTLNGLLHYDKVVNGDHHFTALLGYEYFTRQNSQALAFNSGFGTDLTGYDNLGSGISPVVSSLRTKRVDISGFGRLDYSYKEKYLATFTLRRDGSSVFGRNNKFAVFPGVSLGWKLDQEDFLQSFSSIDLLKLRFGFGVTGNSGIAPYQSLYKYDQGVNSFETTSQIGQQAVTGFSLTDVKESPNLKWESTTQYNAGLDYGFSKRFSGSIDFYVKDTKDMLILLNIPTTTGSSTQWLNAVSMRGYGIEYILTSKNVANENFKWTTDLNFSWLGNKITSYNTNDSSTILGLNNRGIIKGIRSNSYYTNIWTGTIDASSGGLAVKPKKELYGCPDPTYTAGLGNTFTHKQWSLNFFLNSNFGNKLHNQTKAIYSVPEGINPVNGFKDMLRAWSPTNASTDIPQSQVSSPAWLNNSRWIEDAWFIRMQSLTLAYTCRPGLIKLVRSLRIYWQAQNLFIITPYTGLDPELSNNKPLPQTQYLPAYLRGSTDINAYPPARTYTAGISAQF
ncbi:MAG: SusC/RagA family TonB-linked outer membrane protein [Candidatus Nephrothrix sp. EaCA]|nr:MAG: SusC/RagA family TonB-linked outer membrane protein [Candidatus Nephrothrix sp. EaCA]